MAEALARLDETDSGVRSRLLARLATELYLTDQLERRTRLSDEAVAMARRLSDRGALAAALYGRQIAIMGPDGLAERQRAAAEIIEIADQAGDEELAFWGRLFEIWTRTERCLPVRDELAECDRIGERLGLPACRAELAQRRAVDELVAGRHDQADALLNRIEADLPGAALAPVLQSLMILVAYLRGPLEHLEQLVTAVRKQLPDRPLWSASLSALYTGWGGWTRRGGSWRHWPGPGSPFPGTGCGSTPCRHCRWPAFATRSRAEAQTLHRLLAPYQDQASIGAFGSAATAVGLLEATCGRFDAALARLATARERNLATGNRSSCTPHPEPSRSRSRTTRPAERGWRSWSRTPPWAVCELVRSPSRRPRSGSSPSISARTRWPTCGSRCAGDRALARSLAGERR